MSRLILWTGLLAFINGGFAFAQDAPRAAIAPDALPAAPPAPLSLEELAQIARAVEPAGASLEERAQLDRVADLHRQGRPAEANALWQRLAQPASGRGRASRGEIEAWTWYVMYRAFLLPDPALRARAAAVAAATDVQAAAFELQAALQQQQQRYRTMSSVLRELQAAANLTIGNIR